IETRPHFDEMPEAAQEESGADEQHQRQSDLRNHESSRDAQLMLAGARTAAAFAQIGGLAPDSLERGGETEDYSRSNRDEEREEQHVGVDSDFAESGKIAGGEPQQRSLQYHDEQQCEDAGNRGQ